jgi:hypothetical protein
LFERHSNKIKKKIGCEKKMKTSKINRKMLVSTLAVLSLLLVTGYTMVVAENETNVEESPMFDIRTGNAINEPEKIAVSYPNQNIADSANQGENDGESGVFYVQGSTPQRHWFSWLGGGTCTGWTCGSSTGLTCSGISCQASGPVCTVQQTGCKVSSEGYPGCSAQVCCGSSIQSIACIGPAPPNPPRCLLVPGAMSVQPSPGCYMPASTVQ